MLHEDHDEGVLCGRRILVVDDDEDIRIYLRVLLEDEGAEVLTASDGAAAIEVARRERPDLITLDLSMPGVDGVEAFYELRRTSGVKDIPVVIVTGHPEFKKVIYERPVPPPEGFRGKPIEPDLLVADIRRVLVLGDRRRTRTTSFHSS